MARNLARGSGFTEPAKALSSLFTGFDHRHAGSFYQRDYDHQGLVFFTRPRMNLSYNNLVNDRHMLPLATTRGDSIYRAIRTMLDPRIHDYQNGEGAVSDLFDHRQAFIPILSNLCLNLSGFPDVTLETYDSPEGMRKESWSMVDDIADINNTFDITANFANIPGDPITTFFHMWTRYMANVYTDQMVPYPDMVMENEIDYQTRIYRIRLDKSKRFVKKIGCANVAFPVAAPLGVSFNYDRQQPFDEDNQQVSIPFRCVGAEYNDPILVREFNLTVELFNRSMRDGSREYVYHPLTPAEAELFNFEGYPRINETTLELQWWVSRQEYNRVMEDYQWQTTINDIGSVAQI